MTVEQLTSMMGGSFVNGIGRLIDFGGGLGLDPDYIMTHFGEKAITGDVQVLVGDSHKALAMLIDGHAVVERKP